MSSQHPEWTHRFAWGNNPRRAELKGKRCRIIASGSLGTVLLHFEDGSLVTASRRSVRRIRPAAGDPGTESA